MEAELTLLGSYELDDDDFGWIIADGGVEPSRYGASRFHVSYDPEQDADLRGAGRVELAPSRRAIGSGSAIATCATSRRCSRTGSAGSASTTSRSFDHINQVFTELRFQATKRWLLGYKTSFSFDREVFLQNAGLVEYLSKCGCWAGGVELAMDRASGVDVRLIYRLVGLGDDLASSPLLDALEGL